MSPDQGSAARPPREYFSVWHRIARGYGPLAVLVLLLVLVSVLVPSKVPDKPTTIAATGPTGAGTGAAASGTTVPGAAGPAVDPATGQPVSGGTGGQGGAPALGAGAVECAGPQIPGDPYSPPCITFSGDNGGATHRGVTPTEIHVAFRLLNEKGFAQTLAELAGASLVDTPADVQRTVQALADYFNSRMQFYGRKLVIDFYDGSGSNTNELLGRGRDKAVADAARVADDIGAFADLSATSEPYGDALYQKGVVAFGVPYLSREWHTSRRPYVWSLATDCSIVTETVADYILKRLVGGTADWAKGEAPQGNPIAGKPRVITAIAPENEWYQECVRAGQDVLREGGFEYPTGPYKYLLDLGSMSNQAASLIPQLQSSGVTTIVCGCDPIFPVFLSGAAARANYYPEFINIGVALDDFDIVGQLWEQTFTSGSFGISAVTDQANRPPETSLGYQAYKQVRDDVPAFVVDIIYYQMYMLAVGLHMAGPNLTPESFEAGMFAYEPAETYGPAGLWGFGPGDYTPQDDVREIYWDPNVISPYNGKQGSWIDPNPGQRYRRGEIPAGQPPIPPRQR